MPPAFTHENDATMVRAFARTIARIADSRRCFGNVDVHDLALRTVQIAERLARAIELDDEREQREFVGEDTTQNATEPGIVRRRA